MPDEIAVAVEQPAPVAPAPVAAVPATDAPSVEAEPTVEDTPEQKFDKAQKKMERRIGNLTRRNGELMAQLAQHQPRQQPQMTEGEQPAERSEGRFSEQDVLKAAQHLEHVREVTRKSNAIHAEGTKEYPDFMQRFGEMQAALGPQFGRDGRPTAMMEAVLEADAPSKVLYALANDLDLAAEVAGLSPHQMTRRLMKLEAELSGRPKTSAAPKPVNTVKATATESEPDPEDTERWIATRNKKLRSSA